MAKPTLKDVELWLAGTPESEHLEFKEAKTQYDSEKLLKYCVALANEGGGHLVLGVTDKVPRQIVGTSAYRDHGSIRARILEKLRIRVEVAELEHPQGRVVVFDIPSRPQGMPIEIDGQYLMRVADKLLPMTGDQLKRIFDEGKPEFLSHDASSLIDAAEVVSLLDVQAYFDLLALPMPADRSSVMEKLCSEGLIRKHGGGFYIRNLGALLLAKDMKRFDALSRKTVRMIKYKGIDKTQTERDVIGQKGYATGFENLIAHINGQLPLNEVVGEALRREVRMFPEIAIRELVANALVHQDFNETGTSVMVEIYDDRIDISSPGLPLIPENRFVDEYKSRNERLADLMRRMRICEEKGSGIDKVVKSTEEFQLPPPSFKSSNLRTTVTLYAHKEFAKMEPSERVWACYLHSCLKVLSNGKMTNQSLRERFKLADSKAATVSQIISAAVVEGLVKPDSDTQSKKYAKYLPFWA